MTVIKLLEGFDNTFSFIKPKILLTTRNCSRESISFGTTCLFGILLLFYVEFVQEKSFIFYFS